MIDLEIFRQMVKLVAWQPFDGTESAAIQMKNLLDSELSQGLLDFLDSHLPKKRKKVRLGINDPHLASQVIQSLGVKALAPDETIEMSRGIRMHMSKLLKIKQKDISSAQTAMGHTLSRVKIKFDVNRHDKPILTVSALEEQLTKDINTFIMRLKEWYSWHFPELSKIVTDNNL